MAKRKQISRVDEMLDNLLADDHSPEAILGESGLLKQLSKRLVERALAAELSHHLNEQVKSSNQSDSGAKNRRNGSSSNLHSAGR